MESRSCQKSNGGFLYDEARCCSIGELLRRQGSSGSSKSHQVLRPGAGSAAKQQAWIEHGVWPLLGPAPCLLLLSAGSSCYCLAVVRCNAPSELSAELESCLLRHRMNVRTQSVAVSGFIQLLSSRCSPWSWLGCHATLLLPELVALLVLSLISQLIPRAIDGQTGSRGSCW